MDSLDKIKRTFELIQGAKENQDKKNERLSFLMTYLERFYDIPLLECHTTQEKRESEELKLYIEIAKARK